MIGVAGEVLAAFGASVERDRLAGEARPLGDFAQANEVVGFDPLDLGTGTQHGFIGRGDRRREACRLTVEFGNDHALLERESGVVATRFEQAILISIRFRIDSPAEAFSMSDRMFDFPGVMGAPLHGRAFNVGFNLLG